MSAPAHRPAHLQLVVDNTHDGSECHNVELGDRARDSHASSKNQQRITRPLSQRLKQRLKQRKWADREPTQSRLQLQAQPPWSQRPKPQQPQLQQPQTRDVKPRSWPVRSFRYQRLNMNDETGAVTAEYAVVILAAVAFAGLLVVIMRSSEVRQMLVDLVQGALTSTG